MLCTLWDWQFGIDYLQVICSTVQAAHLFHRRSLLFPSIVNLLPLFGNVTVLLDSVLIFF